MYLRVSLFCFTCLVILLLIGSLNLGAEAQTAAFRYNELEQEKFMTSWLILGPIPVSDNPNPDEDAQKRAFGFDFLTDNGGESGISPSQGLNQKINDKDYTWQAVESDGDIIDLVKVYDGKDYCIAYAWAEIEMFEAKKSFLGVGSDDSVKVWLNGKLIHEKWIGRPASKDDDIVPVAFQKGRNHILLKVQNMQSDWGFACREVGNDLAGERLRLAVRTGDLDAIKSIASHGVSDREGDQLYAQMAGQGKFEIFPSSDNEFFWKVTDAKVTFIRGEDGKVTHLIHHQGGIEINAPRLKDEEIAKIDPSILDAYVGEYDFGRAIMKITKEGDHLFAQMADQPKLEIFPRSDTEFFWKVVNAHVRFIKDDSGIVTKAIFQQGDIKFEVKKIN